MIVVGLVYNLIVPGTGTAPAWVSVVLHSLFPLALIADWVAAPDRRPLAWRRLWIVLPYPVAWLAEVLARGVTDGWVPYGFLLPDRGGSALLGTVVALLAALLAAGALVWTLARWRPLSRRVASRQAARQP